MTPPDGASAQMSKAAAGGLLAAGEHNTWYPCSDELPAGAVHDTSRPPSAVWAVTAVGGLGPAPPRLMVTEGWLSIARR